MLLDSHSIDAIFLDLGGTLIHPRHSVGFLYLTIARDHGYGADLSPQDLDRRFHIIFRDEKQKARQQGYLAYGKTESEAHAFWQRVVWRVLNPPADAVADFNALFQDLYKEFAQADAWVIFPDAQLLLEHLHKAGLPVVLVSNWDARLAELVITLGLDAYFEAIVGSYEVGSEKPDVHIFEKALSYLSHDIERNRVVHIGDTYDEDVIGALNAGLRALHLDRRARYAPDPNRISRLDELIP